MKAYTVSQLAQMAGVSVRTLHHYDQIGLLAPWSRTEAGYRLYAEAELLRLQQILFFKELDLPLAEVRQILDDPGFDQVTALKQHRQLLNGRMERLTRLLNTIDRTIDRLREDDMTLTDEELYEGFTTEQAERYKREAREMYDPALVKESERRVKGMSRAQWQAVKDEGEAGHHRPRSPGRPGARRRGSAGADRPAPCLDRELLPLPSRDIPRAGPGLRRTPRVSGFL